jgi:ATP-dependent Clp protease ATP-binding subunit ClpB
LTEAIRRRPYAVVLFDEIEKAHPEIFNTCLQVLDEGRLTDGQGRTVDFTNTVIIMTSNIGSQLLKDAGSADDPKVRQAIQRELEKRFQPEFLNRLDDRIIFHNLQPEDIRQIVAIQMNRLRRLLAPRGLTIQLSEAAVDRLAVCGYDPVYGVRPLKRCIQQLIQDPLALEILEGRIVDNSHIRVDVDPDGDGLRFAASPTDPPTAA